MESYKITPATPIMTIPDDPSGCETTELPSFRYAASSGKVGRGRLCEWQSRVWFFGGLETFDSQAYPLPLSLSLRLSYSLRSGLVAVPTHPYRSIRSRVVGSGQAFIAFVDARH